MDTIILAAGENVRLQVAGLAPGRKPLIIREGEVLVRRLARQARERHGWEHRLIVVCSPSNAEDIVFATRSLRPRYIIQPEASCPQQAVDLALDLVRTDHVMLLMGDNFIEQLPEDQFTGVSVTSKDDYALHPVYEGRFIYERNIPNIGTYRWLGPLIFMPEYWQRGATDWVHAFPPLSPRFNYIKCQAEDMGAL